MIMTMITIHRQCQRQRHRHLICPETPRSDRNRRVGDIILGHAEAKSVLCRTSRFVILPDMKWDPSGPISSLYLLAISTDPTLRSLRDLRGGPDGHVGLLKDIRERAYEVVKARWGLPRGALRMFIHYQPSYCACDWGTWG